MMWYWSGGGVHWWGWLLGFIGMIAFWGLIVWAVWYFVAGITGGSERRQPGPYTGRYPGPYPGPTPAGPGAKQLLDERLARGEIDADEYRRLRDLITGADQGPTPDGTDQTASAAPR